MSDHPPSQPSRTWVLSAFIIALQIVFAAALLSVNAVAENVPGRTIAHALIADAGGVAAPDSAFRPTPLPGEACCARTPLLFRTALTAEDAALADPAILIPSAHDNALLYIDGDLIAGQGEAGGQTTLSRRPILLRIPRAYANAGAQVDIAVGRAIGFGHLRPFHIGEYRDLYPSFLALRVLRSDLPFINAIIGAFVAAFCFCAAPLLGARGLLLSLSGLAAAWALQHVGMLVTDPPWGALANAEIYMVAFLATLAFVVWFFVEWTSVFAPPRATRGWTEVILGAWSVRDRQRVGIAALIVIVIGAMLIVSRLQSDQMIGLQDIDRILGWLGLLAITFCLVRIIAYALRGGLREPIEASAFIFVLLAAIADIAMVRFFHTYGVFLSAAVAFFPLALLVSLAARARSVFEAATATAEKLNALVAERENEILSGLEELQRRERATLLLEERARIMRDMHDGIGGQLLGLMVQARADRLSGAALVRGLEESLDDLRLVVGSLEQGEGTLATALGAFRARIEPRCEAAGATLLWRIEDVGPTPDFGPDKTLQVYRILQEACTNALKHGRPSKIEVTLARRSEGVVELSLADNGKGFDPNARAAGRGLANMRYRAQQIGAGIVLESDGNGTRVTLHLPS
ncbi:sensor histidine kinase [Terricaulis sp.]|uniref:sensor histidine kinase n=1 Tax=Terricaulis sp. TaxID=2768686 RepID=UPI0037847D8B